MASQALVALGGLLCMGMAHQAQWATASQVREFLASPAQQGMGTQA